MPTEHKPPIALVNEYVPPRPPPTKEELKAERRRQLSLQASNSPSMPVATDRWAEWLAMSSKQKFLVSSAVWFVSILFTFIMVWVDFVGTKGGALILIALLGWPIPLFYLIKWLWQEIRKK